MGVIDLDARVKKLESGESGGVDPTVIDQLEAAVTALEETVNGDGETDFGLVGDVAALETTVGNMIEDVTNKIVIAEGLTIYNETKTAYRVGKMITLTANIELSAGASPKGTLFDLYIIDSSIAPSGAVAGCGLDIDSGLSVIAVSAAGSKIQTKCGSSSRFTISWFIN